MELKKSAKADLERKRNTFFLVGLVLALALVLAAFEWNNAPRKAELAGGTPVYNVEEQFIPVTREPKKTPPPPKPKVIEFIEIVDNKFEVDDPEFEESEATEFTAIDVPAVVENTVQEEEEEIFINVVDEPAEFPGGERALYNFISSHVQYPIIAQENGIQGKVYVRFVVDENGNVNDTEIIRPVDPSLDAEALRVIGSLPQFKPGVQAGRNVKVYYTAVINFVLQ